MSAPAATPGTTDTFTPSKVAPVGDRPESPESAISQLLSSNAPAFKFVEAGDTVTGVIVSAQVAQCREFAFPHKAMFYEDGRPREQVVIALETDLTDDADDDGMRTVYVKGWGRQIKALRAAVRGLKRMPESGDTFTQSYLGLSEEKPAKGMDPEKLYTFAVTLG